jgi:putative aldouronate transport system permease protein
MVLPVVAFYIIFSYVPMFGIVIAFKDYTPGKGIWNCDWVGLKNFIEFVKNPYFWRLIRNTAWISVNTLVWGFPAPIILALLINELKNRYFVRTVQTITYLPHFISLVVICGIIKDFTKDTGVITQLLGIFGMEQANMLSNPKLFVPIYVVSDIWRAAGWSSIIYFAALMGVDTQIYEAAIIDGANKWKQTIHVTIPGIMPTIIVMLILKLGGLLNVGFEKIILLYNPVIYETADVISSYVYRKGLQDFAFSFSTAVGLFNSTINFMLLVSSNYISKKLNGSGLW